MARLISFLFSPLFTLSFSDDNCLPLRSRISSRLSPVAVMPWLLTMVGFLLLVTFVPQISLWLPRLLFGG